MSNAKHTPGPWIATKMGYVVTADRKNSIAVTNSANDDELPNARLIAASPDLLAALIAITDESVCTKSAIVEQARAAIAKAKGE